MSETEDSDDWLILGSAAKHGIVDDDIHHALRHAWYAVEEDDDVTMYIGPARNGSPLEVGVKEKYGITAILHAMPRRPQYER